MSTSMSSSGHYLLLVGAIALVLAGFTLLGYSLRLRSEGLSRRLSLVEPYSAPRANVSRADDRSIRETYLLHGTASAFAERDQREIIRLSAALRIPMEYAFSVFLAFRLACIAIFGFLAFFMGLKFHFFSGRSFLVVLAAMGFGIAGWFIPAMVVSRLSASRAKAAASGLPDALELLVVCVEAGLALEDGIDRIAKELRNSHPELAAELAQTSADLKILPSRDQALTRLAERVDAPSVRSFVITLSQTLRFGTPLAQALRVVASEMRNDSLLEMEERANRLPTLLTLPMMLFIMPTIFLIVGGPAALKVLDVFLR